MNQDHEALSEKQRLEIDGGPYGLLIYDGPPIADSTMSPGEATLANIGYWQEHGGNDRVIEKGRETLLRLIETDLANACSILLGSLERELDEAEHIRNVILWHYKFDVLTGVGYGDDFRTDPDDRKKVAVFVQRYGQKTAIANVVIDAMQRFSGADDREGLVRAGINAFFDAHKNYPASFGIPIKKPLYPGQVEGATYNVAGWIGANTSLNRLIAPRLVAAMRQDADKPVVALTDQLPGATFEAWVANDKFDPEGVRRAVRRLLERREPDPGTTVPFHDENAVQVPGLEEFAARDQVREQNMAAFVELREMAGLTKLENRILDMHLEERPAKEIARALGATTTENSVNQAMHRIRGKIREAAETSA